MDFTAFLAAFSTVSQIAAQFKINVGHGEIFRAALVVVSDESAGKSPEQVLRDVVTIIAPSYLPSLSAVPAAPPAAA